MFPNMVALFPDIAASLAEYRYGRLYTLNILPFSIGVR